jgi:sulfite reductase (NADPH) flavoprotein alpha-component
MTDKFSRNHPFMASIHARHTLCRPGSLKETIHLEIDLKGSDMQYVVGDSIAVIPANDPELVQCILKCLKASGNEWIDDSRSKQKIQLIEFLLNQANLRDCTRKFIDEIAKRQTAVSKKTALEKLFETENSEPFKIYQNAHDVLDALEDNQEVVFSPQELCDLLKPMMPRFYSISSSQKAVGDQVHLTVVLQKWDAKGRKRHGVCTHYLCNLTPLNVPVVPVYLHPHRGFTLPKDPNAPIIMVGPGTGIAPFRAFMQERDVLDSMGKNWLFFGEWNRSHHFFYEDFWNSLQNKGKMRMDLAFSRDQNEKIYVQHKMLEKGKELFQWLEEGAYFYVCGDATRMSKDVDLALHQIVAAHGGLSDEKTKEYIKALRNAKRYLKDVY